MTKKVITKPSSSISSSPTFSVDIERAIHLLNTTFNPSHADFALQYQVSHIQNGYEFISMAIPEGYTKGLVTVLEGLLAIFKNAHFKVRAVAAENKALSIDDQLRREQNKQESERLVCGVFDEFRNQGYSINDSISRTNAALKDKGALWVSYDIVKMILRSAGRLRTKYKVQKMR